MGKVIAFATRACSCGWPYPKDVRFELRLPFEAPPPPAGTVVVEFDCPSCGDRKEVVFGRTKVAVEPTEVDG